MNFHYLTDENKDGSDGEYSRIYNHFYNDENYQGHQDEEGIYFSDSDYEISDKDEYCKKLKVRESKQCESNSEEPNHASKASKEPNHASKNEDILVEGRVQGGRDRGRV